MSFVRSDDITPWDEVQNIHFTYHSEEKQDLIPTITKKYSSNLQTRIPRSVTKKKILNKKRGLLNSTQHTKSLITQEPITQEKSQKQFTLIRHEKLKTEGEKQKIRRYNQSDTIYACKEDKELPSIGYFAIKKYSRMKKFERFLVKEGKVQDIFKKIQEIQNPSNRQNVILPRIQLKI